MDRLSEAKTFTVVSWNIQGISRNFGFLHSTTKKYCPDLSFLSEPQIFNCNIGPIEDLFSGSYDFYLNSEDMYDPSLPLSKSIAKGGTMVLWNSSLSPFMKVLQSSSSSFISVLFSPDNLLPSVHIGVYLPTSGREGEWLASLSELEEHIADIAERFDPFSLFLRGDFNCKSKNHTRIPYLEAFIQRLNLIKIYISHNTYHHFIGDSSSDLDLILYKAK